jgi:hypothetical protein
MDEGIERIRRLSRQARAAQVDGSREVTLEQEARDANREVLRRLEARIPERLAELAAASDGDLVYEGSAFRSSTATALRIQWRPGTRQAHQVELWLLREPGSVEWRWSMGHREPPIVHRVPASRFDLARLDDMVAALADPERWRGGHPPEI